MKRGSTIFLRGVVILLGLMVLVFCALILRALLSPEGVVYYQPILIGILFTVIPFYFAIYQTMKLLGYIDQNRAFSDLSVNALKKIKYSALIISALYTLGMPYIFYAANLDDAPGVVVIGLVFIFAPLVVGIFSAVLQRVLQEAIDIKNENDLTV